MGEDAWRSRPFGEDEWVKRTASELRLEHTIGSEGRATQAMAFSAACWASKHRSSR